MSRSKLDRSWRRRLNALALRFRRDRRGGTAVQALVLLPSFIIPLVAFVIAWQTLSVKRTLHTATYEAVRYLALYPPEDERRWQPVANQIIRQSMHANQFITRTDVGVSGSSPRGLNVSVDFIDGELTCGSHFRINAEFEHDMPSVEPFPSGVFWLTESREGEILCR